MNQQKQRQPNPDYSKLSDDQLRLIIDHQLSVIGDANSIIIKLKRELKYRSRSRSGDAAIAA
jgi:hypothetical protein